MRTLGPGAYERFFHRTLPGINLVRIDSEIETKGVRAPPGTFWELPWSIQIRNSVVRSLVRPVDAKTTPDQPIDRQVHGEYDESEKELE